MIALIWWPDNDADRENELLDDFSGVEVASVGDDSSVVVANSQNSLGRGIFKKKTNLKPGDDFPYRKTITQQVSQDRLDGTHESRTSVEIEMNLRVINVLPDDAIDWSVTFTSVKYRREKPDGTVEYRSASSPNGHPPEAALYAGLKYSGFKFQQNTREGTFVIDHRDAFLKHVLRFLPALKQKTLLKNYLSHSHEKTIALFVDESLGQANLVSEKKVGESLDWTYDDFDPVPFRQRTVFEIGAKQNRKTSVEIRGRVIPTSVSSTTGRQQIQCSIIGGVAEGAFQVDDASGLPEKKSIQREITMRVSLPDGRRFLQTQISQQKFERLPGKVQIANAR